MAIESDLGGLIDSSLPRDDASRLRVFAEKLFAREPSELRENVTAAARLAMVRAAFEFFSERVELIAVRVEASADGIVTVETVMADCPFIIDSLHEYFRHEGALVRTMLHPVYRVTRDSAGQLKSFEQGLAAERGESFVHAEVEMPATEERAREIAKEVSSVLREVRQATGDFSAMTSRALQICEETAATRELVEVREFLRWLVHGGFVFLGYRRYLVGGSDSARKFTVEAGSELGIMRDRDESRFRSAGSLDDIAPARRKLFFEGPPLVIAKTRAESHVHRRALMDSVTLRRTGSSGRVESFDHFVGLFTSKAYVEEAQHIPVLRAKLRGVLETEGAVRDSHDYKQIVAAFNSFPKDELFRASVAELREQLRVVLDVKSEAEVRLSFVSDQHRNNVIALVVMPREAFSADVRMKIQELLARRLAGSLVYYYLAIGEGYTARLHFCFQADAPRLALVRELETETARIARRWEDRLLEAAVAKLGAARGRALAARWMSAFSADYRATVAIPRTLADIERVEAILAGGGAFSVESQPAGAGEDGASELRIIGLGEPPMLSDLMPTLQNFGIAVLSESAHEFMPEFEGKATRAYAQAFSVLGPGRKPFAKMPGTAVVADAIVAVRAGLAADDQLNSLVLATGLNWREVALLRAYLAAAFQMRLVPARPALTRVMLQYPELARTLFDLFAVRFDPDSSAPRPAAAPAVSDERFTALRDTYLAKLSAIDNIADDRAARALLSMLEATVRTNYYQKTPSPDPYLALKFESGKIAGLPDTPPLYEIHVNSPRMEGCHLRAGKIARGGIRFSDRPDDYRTEILELMKTQTVKNAIIVPIGSKGGFVVKPRPGQPPDANDGVDAYRTLIIAMLDLTDNVVASKIVHPERVKVLDTDGPYLVVAADKGTATFSDLANSLAIERGFWLGDAFASGGEHGYDHKKMGITARGAWESARRHLREMGLDPDRGVPITMVGIGDMSGDVFGNGLLQSRNVKLVAAFDHRHIFLDPDPDPAASFVERKRLYELPHSQWSDYDAKLLSPGGGIFRRGQKRIELSDAARKALGSDAEALDGESLVHAILRAPVDMLYNGGIGTYVRVSDETDAEVGDHANDACRITAQELRAKVVVEGGNLGFTQRARIEYALNGGRINTDAIDNSAGVDTSDHEVNLKILLAPPVARGTLSFEERNRALAKCGDEVAERVLRDNRDQVLMLSLEQVRSRTQTSGFRDHLQAIEERGLLRRHEEALPTREALRERRARFPGLTRPELAVLTAYTKIDLGMRLEESALIEEPYLVGRFLVPYFPASIAARFANDLPSHRLRRELIATTAVNELVDLMGSIFVFSVVRDHGVGSLDAVRAWIIAGDVLAIPEKTEALKQRAVTMSADAELSAFFALERACRSATVWALENCGAAVPIDASVSRFKPALDALMDNFETMLAAGERERLEKLYRELRAAVGDGELAHELARIAFAEHLLDVLSLSFACGIPAATGAEAYFGLSVHLDFALIEAALDSIASDDRWELRAAQELASELRAARLALCRAVLDDQGRDSRVAIERLLDTRERRFAEVERLFGELKNLPAPSLPALHVTIRALSRLANRAVAATPQS
ncbi:MAG TPA: NAD-glutamate dehydrogenase domain-containing protein [Candidatus Binataceae bacterium]